MEKKEIRRQIRELKKKFSAEEKKAMSESIWEKIEENLYFRKARTILLYWSMEDEVYTHDFVQKWAGRKNTLLPCVVGDELVIRHFDGMDGLCPGAGYGIPEPVDGFLAALDEIDVVIVPGVAFDRKGNRLGRGKGYYDKMLCCTSAWKIGICFDFQLLDSIPVESQDISMDEVITNALY